MPRSLCIHGHFYQPPRQDPWLEAMLPEPSAAPMRDWNERICRESYAPLAAARRMDDAGRITSLVNCYEYISFNVGPTLMHWLEHGDPETYARILEADAASVRRFGRGNAMAQVRHHAIMPLASARDKRIEIAWGVADFQRRFGRDPEGMWLAEAAVDTATLEALAEAGIAFTLLAPRQGAAVTDESGNWREVDEGSLDISRPYLAELPSGRSIAVFFYHGALSRAVAFERLLADGEAFWQRLSQAAGPGLTALATDGETYGHHFTFGEMSLAYVLEQAETGRDGLALTNFAAHLAAQAPQQKLRLREPSSWSCVHGVERWRSDCGCTDGGHPTWNQKWRAPLRAALAAARRRVDDHFDATGPSLFTDPEAALLGYGAVDSDPQSGPDFARRYFRPELDENGRDRAWRILAMQKWSLASFASCAWFFDDIARLEGVNALTFAARSLELCRDTGGIDARDEVAKYLAAAVSNMPGEGTGADVWHGPVARRVENPARLAALALLCLMAAGRLARPGDAAEIAWPAVTVAARLNAAGGPEAAGEIEIRRRLETLGRRLAFRIDGDVAAEPLACEVTVDDGTRTWSCPLETDLPGNKRREIAARFAEAAEERLWQAGLAAARTGVGLFLPYGEAQSDQIAGEAWRALAAPLAYLRCLGAEGTADLDGFLVQALAGTGSGGPVEARLGRALAELVAAGEFDKAAILVERSRVLGLLPQTWAAQNALYAAKRPLHPLLAGLLGFAPGA